VKGEWINPGAIVIDVGVNQGVPGVDEKSIVGDVEYEEVILAYIKKIGSQKC
jgi:5,10-methylene-tetrahydrofolate dehydrogenase/methenyl tetrahydrofolate cyclohydrolase